MTRHAALARLDALVGTWDTKPLIDGKPLHGAWASFEWIDDGAFLVMRSDAELPPDLPPRWRENSPFPVTVYIGLEDRTQQFGYLYADGRNVHRVYSMSFDGREWRIWGQSGPESFQRFYGELSDDGNRIDGRWEQSADGESWEVDFELMYERRG